MAETRKTQNRRRGTRAARAVAGATVVAVAVAALAGCATYKPLPLPPGDDLAAAVAHPPLDMDAVATLAVLRNPDLAAARARLHIAAAQAFAAGILPDPQVNASTDHPTDHVSSTNDPRYPEFNAYGFGLDIDLRALLTYRSTRAAADAALRQARAELLWREWQTVAQARLLYAAQSINAQRLATLAPATALYASTATQSERALAQGNVTLEQTGADQAALVAARAQEGAARREHLQLAAALDALLGLKPDVRVKLAGLGAPAIPTRAAVSAAVAELPRRRPDLRALRAGYASEEAAVRIAVLSQFPNVVVGINRARDTSAVHTLGGAVSLTLPLFDRGRGQIAIERATRAALRAEYQARLDQAASDVWQLWREQRELSRELAELDGRLPRLHRDAVAARREYLAGNFPAASYLGLVNADLAAQTAHFDLLQSLWTDSIALATVAGTQVEPAAHASTDPHAP